MRRAVILSLPLWALIAGFTAYGWIAIPEDASVPVHWNFQGVPDRYGSKFEALSFVPVTALIVSGLFALPPLINPGGANIRRSPLPHLAAWIGLLALFAVMQAVVVLTGAGVLAADSGSPIRIILLAVSVLLVVLGNLMPKARPNWIVGVRTPWSLASEQSWDKSQRLGGALLMLSGLLGIVGAAALSPAGAMTMLLAGTLASAIVSTAMSYVWWRQDPGRPGRDDAG